MSDEIGDAQPNPRQEGPLPALDLLYVRHPGLTPAVCASYAEAASVCLSRHHTSPVDFDINKGSRNISRQVTWNPPSAEQQRAWNNVDDATRDGAYSVCLAAVEVETGLVAINRAETRTGADYYLGPSTSSLEQSYRLEVSGVDRGDVSTVARRLRQKVAQTKLGKSNLPAIASVVGFLVKRIGIERVIE